MNYRIATPVPVRILQALRSIDNNHRGRSRAGVYASYRTVARMLAVSTKTVQRHLKAMEESGLVSLERRSGRPSLFGITPLGNQVLSYRPRATPPSQAKLSRQPRTDCPQTPDSLSSNQEQSRIEDQQPLPAALLKELERAYQGAEAQEVVWVVNSYSWVVQVATLEEMLVACDRVKFSAAKYAATVARTKSELPESALRVSYDRPDYDPYAHGAPKEPQNRPLWELRERFPEATSLAEAREQLRVQREADEWLERDRIATAEELTRDACIERWEAVPAEKLVAFGYTSAAEVGQRSMAIVERLKRRGGPRGN